MSARKSLARRLSRFVILGFAAIWLLALVATAVVLRHEQQELADTIIRETAQIYLPAMVADYRVAQDAGATFPVEIGHNPRFDKRNVIEADDAGLVYRLLDRSGAVLMISLGGGEVEFPPLGTTGFSDVVSHKFYTTSQNSEGFVMQVGDPLRERSAAYLESLTTLFIPMVAILPLAYLTVMWIAQRALAPLERMRDEIEARNDARLDPIDAGDQPAELRAITATLNGFMIRLSQALDGERAFATNAAHELRTPVAVALAQTQRMRAEVGEDDAGRLAAIEEALKRMSRLVERLLQLARAEAGIGLSEDAHDLGKLMDVVLSESQRNPDRQTRLRVVRPDQPVLSKLDPDAFAMIAGNLIDNAFQHAPPDTLIEVELTQSGMLRIANDGPVFSQAELELLPRRFQRGTKGSDGFGLGLYIANKIARHSGGRLILKSPASGKGRGFEASFVAPLDNPKTTYS
ncbi:HAMP domain-containing sensor histidine kinase [Aliiroseovarius sp. F47248L]|uniref:sensor histidine kinase n=1 Tax=Aliiroseovarius sp. F47248L TaxID=2926420 RepID=UPI001FF44C4E|nr:HAMP domain-containing sensor histidine kinase [Aliiroseovarius sp. F47248L]MCK0137879.1 HAMP domain-containing histidine kinase [Aliiroseovarius sp. F47248L]